jgi:putative transposase
MILLLMNRFKYRPSYRRNLPHIQPPGASFFMTFRLAGSLPQSVVKQWNVERQWLSHLAQTNPNHFDQVKHEFDRRWFAKFELLLDQATIGPTWLNDTRIATMLTESLHYRDGKVYRLDAFTIMSNHVHTVFKPLPRGPINRVSPDDVQYYSLASIMHSLKGYTAFQANRILGREGEFWAHESYDHWIRDYPEWQRIIAYVLNNPVKAGCCGQWRDWQWSYVGRK